MRPMKRAPPPSRSEAAVSQKKLKTEELNKWEEMHPDLLRLIFSKFKDAREVIASVWSVCPQWDSVMCDFLFRKEPGVIDFGELETMQFISNEFHFQPMLVETMKGAQSDGHADVEVEEIFFPRGIRLLDTHLLYVAQRSSRLKRLSIATPEDLTGKGFSRAIRNWSVIEEIMLGQLDDLFIEHIIMEIGIKCKNLKVLCLYDCFLDDFYAPVLSRYLRQLEVLQLHWVFYSEPAVKWLLSKCPKLRQLELSKCYMYVETGKWFKKNGHELICCRTYKREIRIKRIQGSKPVNWSIDGDKEGYTSTELRWRKMGGVEDLNLSDNKGKPFSISSVCNISASTIGK